jgi:hypothetical protein
MKMQGGDDNSGTGKDSILNDWSTNAACSYTYPRLTWRAFLLDFPRYSHHAEHQHRVGRRDFKFDGTRLCDFTGSKSLNGTNDPQELVLHKWKGSRGLRISSRKMRVMLGPARMRHLDAPAAIDRAMRLRTNQPAPATAPAREQIVKFGNCSQVG